MTLNESILMEFFYLKQNSPFAFHDSVGIKLLSRLRLKFSHLNERRFCHSFKYDPGPICYCGPVTETIDHFFLHCPFFAEDSLKIDVFLKKLNEKHFLFGSDKYST